MKLSNSECISALDSMTIEQFFPDAQKPGLFRSAAWLLAWEQCWGDHHKIAILPSPAISQNILSLCVSICRVKICKKGFLRLSTAFPLGVSTATAPSIRSEYFFFPVDEAPLEQRVIEYLDSAMSHPWDQFYFPDILKSAPEYLLLPAVAKRKNLMPIIEVKENTYGIAVNRGSFTEYLAGLGKNTRLKLFNRRKNLAGFGDITVENIWPDRERFFYLLDDFHEKRWGKPCYKGRNRSFIEALLDNIDAHGGEIDLSILSVAGRPLSALLDIRVSGRQYNLQSGYIENFDKQISLGTLHFGYQIEAAFDNKTVDFYDFMAGTGKNADYKKFMATHSDQFVSLLLIRSPWLKLAHKAKDLFKRTILRFK